MTVTDAFICTFTPTHTIKSATGSLFEKLPHHPTTTTTTGPATTTTTAASILSPAAILDRVNAGIEAATETVKGVLPVALGGTEMQQQGPAAGLSIKAPVEGVKSMMPSTPFPTPVAGGGEQAPSALSPAAIAESINEALEKGGEATQGPVKAVKETVSSTLGAVPTPPSPAQVAESVNRGIEQGGKAVAAATEKGKEAVGGVFAALPTLLPSPAAVAERINRAIDTTGTGASSGRGAPEQGWEGEAGAGGGGTAGFGEAYDQRARVKFASFVCGR